MREIWEPIEENEEFIVSNLGRIEDLERSRYIPTRRNREGFIMVTLRTIEHGQMTRSVASLVAHAFVERPLPDFNTVIHLNGDREDCRAMNLMWRSRPFAQRYHQQFNRPAVRVAVYIPELDEAFPSLREACTTYGLLEDMIYNTRLGHNLPCFPYSWTIERLEK